MQIYREFLQLPRRRRRHSIEEKGETVEERKRVSLMIFGGGAPNQIIVGDGSETSFDSIVGILILRRDSGITSAFSPFPTYH